MINEIRAVLQKHKDNMPVVAMAEILSVMDEAENDSAWKVIYNKVCVLEKQYANLEGWENVNRCIQLENLLQYFKEQLGGGT